MMMVQYRVVGNVSYLATSQAAFSPHRTSVIALLTDAMK
jgi:hypothetical protein